MSGETKWTPGPWVIDAETRPAEVCTVHHTSHENGFVYVRGELGYWGADENENWANAQLIASAPDLYEALEVALLAMEHMGNAVYAMDGVMAEDRKHLPALDKARAALAKARGESK